MQIADGIQVRVIRTPNWLHCPATRQGAFQDAGKNTPGQNTGKKQTQETGFVTVPPPSDERHRADYPERQGGGGKSHEAGHRQGSDAEESNSSPQDHILPNPRDIGNLDPAVWNPLCGAPCRQDHLRSSEEEEDEEEGATED